VFKTEAMVFRGDRDLTQKKGNLTTLLRELKLTWQLIVIQVQGGSACL
jgi:hypothetical protein